MRIANFTIHFIEWILISLLSLCGSFSFTNSNLYVWIQSSISSHIPEIIPYLPEIIWGILFLFGLQSIILRNKGGGSFTWLVIVVSLPSILSFDTINIFKVFGLDLKAMSKINFYGLLGIGVSIVIGYVLLNHLCLFKQNRLSLIKRRADPGDIDKVNTHSYLLLLISIAVTLFLGILVALVSHSLELLILPLLNRLSWNAALIGLGCILILAVFIYWLGSQRQSGTGR